MLSTQIGFGSTNVLIVNVSAKFHWSSLSHSLGICHLHLPLDLVKDEVHFQMFLQEFQVLLAQDGTNAAEILKGSRLTEPCRWENFLSPLANVHFADKSSTAAGMFSFLLSMGAFPAPAQLFPFREFHDDMGELRQGKVLTTASSKG